MIATLPLLHPAAIVRGAYEQEPNQITHLEHARDYIDNNFDPVDISRAPPNSNLYPTIEALRVFSSRPQITQGVSIDIESAGNYLRCIGFTRIADLHYVCVRFRRQGGAVYHRSFEDLYLVVEWTYNLLKDPRVPKVFQNGQAFDVIELEMMGYDRDGWYGFEVNGYTDNDLGFDTMLGHMTALSGFPKGLQVMSTVLLAMPNWKKLVKVDDEAEGKG